MPCRVDPTPEEIAQAAKRRAEAAAAPAKKEAEKANRRLTASSKQIEALETANNALSVRVDYLQDLVWRMDKADTTAAYNKLKPEINAVLEAQEKHRQADLDRLVRVLSASEPIDYEKLRKVLAADTSKPLEPQLGFNPDDF